MPRTTFDRSNVQGGKQWGQAKQRQTDQIDDEIDSIITQNTYPEVEELDEKLVAYKDQFITYDLDGSGDLDDNDVRVMMEKLGQLKNHIEIRKMIKEIDLNGSGTINFREFVQMMLGGKTSIMRMILMFEEKNKEKEKPVGPPPKKSFSDLP
uniref:Allograft inflammatory factor 1 n=1 Tax=Sterechinus neumayeri TaxID=53479 RepID=C1KG55_STENE|nr:allograft inflammatory factor 1 [Sterechinus neumayeri]